MASRKNRKKSHCCEKCQNYWTCETKWYRGEQGLENVCCPLCTSYLACWGIPPESVRTSSMKASS